MNSLKYRPEIDGLRAIAVLSVIFFHMKFDWIPGGFVGVDIFFVISGYLITSLIIKEHQNAFFSLKNFWARRIRRIFPALLVMTGTTLLGGGFLLYDNEHQVMGEQALSAVFSVANIHMWLLTRDYWGPQAEDSLFLHAWSLSVEEQFYLTFPILALVFLKKYPRYFPMTAFLLTVFGYVFFAYFAPEHPNAAFYLMPSRFWELSMGSSLALYQSKIDQLSVKWKSKFFLLAWVGLILIFLSFVFVSGEEGINWEIIFPTVGAFFFIAGSRNTSSIPAQILSFQPVVFIGKISYSLYLWHWPVLLFFHNTAYDFSLWTISILIFALSILSYFFVEKPTRHNPKALPFIIVLFVVCSFIGFLFSTSEESFDISDYDRVVWSGPHYDVSPLKKSGNIITQKKFEGIYIKPRQITDSTTLAEGGIIKDYGNTHPRIMLLGDSHSLMWAPILDEIADELNVSISFCGMDGVPPYINPNKKNKPNQYDIETLAYIQKWKPIVILSSRWSYFWNKKLLEETIELITQNGGRTLLIQQPPELFFGDKNAPKTLSFMGIKPEGEKEFFIPSVKDDKFNKIASFLRVLSEKKANCQHIEIADLFLNEDGMVKVLSAKKVFYIDEDHLSLEGAKLAKERIARVIADMLSSK